MSPLVQRPRTSAVQATDPANQHWSMLLFESCSAGVLALGMGIASVMLVVSVYAIFVWPLTFWDLANLGLEKYAEYGNTALWSIFAGGTLAGYWCFSGEAFKNRHKAPPKSAVRTTRTRR
jgi:hypothetical protein